MYQQLREPKHKFERPSPLSSLFLHFRVLKIEDPPHISTLPLPLLISDTVHRT